MAYQDDPSGKSEIADLYRRIRALEAGSPLGNSSITEGRLRVASPEGLLVEGSARVSGQLDVDGTETVSGTLTVTGTLNADGTISLTGPVTITGTTSMEGDTTQVGAHHVQGDQDITGTLAVKGAATLENDLTVQIGGKITVAGADPVVLGVTSGGAPGLEWSAGGTVVGGSSSVSLAYTNKLILAGASGAQLGSGSSKVNVTDAGTTISGDMFSNLPTISASGRTPNVWCDPSTKKFYRLT